MDAFTLTQCIALAGMAALLARSVWTDISELRIPNTVCAGMVLLWAAYAATKLAAGGDPLILHSIFWAFVVLAGGFVIYCLGWMGAGDIKLISALALWAGPVLLPTFLLVTALAGGAISLGYIGFRCAVRRLSVTPHLASFIPRRWISLVDAQTGAQIPYAPSIAVGASVILWTLSQGLLAPGIESTPLIGLNG